ncbi:MAG: hypothetical protein OXG36_03870 [Caldilineaceae bacterium]|nr:hypothetical protein [Caldilineaceae bacterium]
MIDSNLLVLYIAGHVDLAIIDTHRRLREFLKGDHEILEQHLSMFNGIMVTPNVLTETSNLLGYHDEPERTRLFQYLRDVISNSTELLVESVVASAADEFPRFGLCDSVMLEIASPDQQILTMDRALHGLCNKKTPNSSVCFHDLRFPMQRPRRRR